jgi:hypothetical protein
MPAPHDATLSNAIDHNPKARSLWCLAAAALMQIGLLVYLPPVPFRVTLAIILIGLALAIGVAVLFVRNLPGAGYTVKALLALTALEMTAFPWRSRLTQRLFGENPADWLVWMLAAVIIGGFVHALWKGSPRIKTAALLLLAAIFAYRCHFGIRHVNEKEFDVIFFHHTAYQKLLMGGNPYSPPTPIYLPLDEARKIYPPTRVREGFVESGYVYPPLSLLLRLPPYLLAHDMRYGPMVELLLAAWLLTRLAPGDTGRLAAAVLLTNPFAIEVVSLGWGEPGIVMLFLAFLWCWRRWPAQAGWLFGWLVSIKQTMVMWAPLAGMLLAGRFLVWPARIRWTAQAIATAGAPLALGLALWGFKPLYDSTVRMHAEMTARSDSLTFARFATALPPAILNLVSLIGVGFFLVFLAIGWKRGWTVSLPHWVALSALSWTAFFYFNRQAFGNYYFFVICLWLTAAVMIDTTGDDRTSTESLRLSD